MNVHRQHPNGGFTLIEAVVSILIVGLMLVAAMQTVGAARVGQWKTANQARAEQLGFDLLEEVLAQRYEDPDQSATFGLESGESAQAGRSAFDDVDDYNGIHSGPPERRDGTVIPGMEEMARAVQVEWVVVDHPDGISNTPTNVKRITVTTSQRGVMLAKAHGLKTRAGDDE